MPTSDADAAAAGLPPLPPPRASVPRPPPPHVEVTMEEEEAQQQQQQALRQGQDTSRTTLRAAGLAIQAFQPSVRYRRAAKKKQKREERYAADELFQLVWTVVAVLYLIAVLSTSSPYTPQHDGQAGALISQTKQWLTGTPDGNAWSASSETNYNKSTLVTTLNNTILEAMYKTHVTHTVFHFHCDARRRRRRLDAPQLSLLERHHHHGTHPQRHLPPAAAAAGAAAPKAPVPPPPPPAAAAAAAAGPEDPADAAAAAAEPRATTGPGLLELPTGPDILHTAQCSDIPTHTPHRGGLWMYMISQDPAENAQGCPLQHDAVAEPNLDVPWGRTDYTITGQLSKYQIVSQCASSANFEVGR